MIRGAGQNTHTSGRTGSAQRPNRTERSEDLFVPGRPKRSKSVGGSVNSSAPRQLTATETARKDLLSNKDGNYGLLTGKERLALWDEAKEFVEGETLEKSRVELDKQQEQRTLIGDAFKQAGKILNTLKESVQREPGAVLSLLMFSWLGFEGVRGAGANMAELKNARALGIDTRTLQQGNDFHSEVVNTAMAGTGTLIASGALTAASVLYDRTRQQIEFRDAAIEILRKENLEVQKKKEEEENL